MAQAMITTPDSGTWTLNDIGRRDSYEKNQRPDRLKIFRLNRIEHSEYIFLRSPSWGPLNGGKK